jgi:hypothetical protein
VPGFISSLEKKKLNTFYLTVEQVREAADAWLLAQSYPPRCRQAVYQKAANRIAYRQRRNRQSRKASRKATLRQLHQLGIKLGSLNSCVPHDL